MMRCTVAITRRMVAFQDGMTRSVVIGVTVGGRRVTRG